MSTEQHTEPAPIDPWQFSLDQAVREGTLNISELPRLASLLTDRAGVIDYTVSGAQDSAGQRLINVTLQARPDLQMQCQRCLEPCAVSLQVSAQLAVAKSDETGADLPPDYEPLLAEPTTIANIVEEEILLALPQEPKHSDPGDCGEVVRTLNQTSGTTSDPDRRKPFAGLADLLKD